MYIVGCLLCMFVIFVVAVGASIMAVLMFTMGFGSDLFIHYTAAVNPLQAASPNSFHILFSSSRSSVGILLVSPSSLERRGTKHFQIHLLDVPFPIGQPTVGDDSFICSNVSDEHYETGLGVLTTPLNSIAASTTSPRMATGSTASVPRQYSPSYFDRSTQLRTIHRQPDSGARDERCSRLHPLLLQAPTTS